jgi:hypothetical protein
MSDPHLFNRDLFSARSNRTAEESDNAHGL